MKLFYIKEQSFNLIQEKKLARCVFAFFVGQLLGKNHRIPQSNIHIAFMIYFSSFSFALICLMRFFL